MDCSHLKKAPITEAVIDIQCVVDPPLNPAEILRILKDSHSKISSDYPIIQNQMTRQVKADLQEIGIKDTTNGYLFRSEDQTKVVQFRINGFALSHLKPYRDWPTLIEEAKQLWLVYTSSLPVIVQRLATRFINQLQVPYPLPEGEEYLTNIKKPLTEPNKVSLIRSFIEQASSIEQATEISVNFIRLMERPVMDATEASVVLDIDVFKMVSDLIPSNPKIWQIIESFREVKNRIFFKAIGLKTVEKYK